MASHRTSHQVRSDQQGSMRFRYCYFVMLHYTIGQTMSGHVPSSEWPRCPDASEVVCGGLLMWRRVVAESPAVLAAANWMRLAVLFLPMKLWMRRTMSGRGAWKRGGSLLASTSCVPPQSPGPLRPLPPRRARGGGGLTDMTKTADKMTDVSAPVRTFETVAWRTY